MARSHSVKRDGCPCPCRLTQSLLLPNALGLVAAGIGGLLALSGCTVGPDYERPDAPVPAAYKEAWKPGPIETGWRQARPSWPSGTVSRSPS